jgi:redox-sensitive bicupin YhaK (pirin superfamily)
MRRLVGTALLTTVLLASAACGTKTDETPSATTTSSAPTAPATSAPEDKAAACAAYQKEWETLQLRALEAVTALIGAGQDKAKATKASEDLKQLYTEMQTSADKHLATATNPEFKAALSGYAEQLKSARGQLDAAGQDAEKLLAVVNNDAFQSAVEKLADLCGV